MTTTKTPCDLLITAPWLLPIAPVNESLQNHAIAITDGTITAIGPSTTLQTEYIPAETLSLDHHIVMPGLINAHGHAAMTLLRGAGEDQPLEIWLNETIWPMEAKLVDEHFVRLGSELAIAEMLLSGTTTFSDMYFFPEQVAQLCHQLGMRCQLAFPLIEFPNAWSQGIDDGIHKGLALNDAYRHSEFVEVAFGPHSAYVVDMPNLERVAMYANELETRVQIHLHETATEVANARAAHGKSWIELLHEIGLLSPQTQAVHMTQVSAHELELVAGSGAQVVHCPTSNLKLASGYCPVSDLRRAGVCVALGTDGAASNNRLDLLDEARLAALLSKHVHNDAASGTAADVVQMATLDGARALGTDNTTGSLELGKQADFIAVDAHALGMMPLYNPFGALVHGNAGNAVDHVFIAGKPMVQNGRLSCMDQDDLTARIQAWHASLD